MKAFFFSIALCIVAILITSSQVSAQTVDFLKGQGTEENPYLVENLGNLLWISRTQDFKDRIFIQVADIDASETINWHSGAGWEPIGTTSSPFTGSYDGNGYTISNLHINRPDDRVGLFNLVSGATLENISLENVNFTGRNGGSIASTIKGGGELINSYSTGELNGTANGGTVYMGGLVAGISGQSVIQNSSTSVNITSANTASRNGGLLGQIYNGTVLKSYATGDVEGGHIIGGLIAETYNGIVENSYSLGNVTGTSDGYLGGLVGFYVIGGSTDSKYIKNSYFEGSISGTGTLGGLVGALNPSDIGSTIENSYWNENNGGADNGVGIALTIDEFRDENSFDGFDFTSEWKIFQGATFPYLSNFDYSEYPGFVLSTGSGTSVDPFEINTPPQLSAIQINLDAHYKLTSNIDLSTATSDGGIFWFDGKGWDPIGNSSTPFVGSLDGNGYTISNIFINREGQLGVGLFGRINAGGEITRLAFENADITGGSNTGIITGYLNDATIEEIWVSGEVSGSSNVGGIVGNNIGGDISSSYSSADVSGAGSIGGAVGYHNNSGTLSTSYSTGTATGDTNTGALVGRNLATITDSYWNSTTGSPDNGEGTALTSIEMREETSFTGFDFTTNWQIIEAAAFPTLINNEQTPAPGFAFDNGDGSSGDPYEISNPEQLNAVRAFPDEYFELVSDIDLTEATGSSEGILWNDGKGFDPISNAVGTSSFSGSFDGNEHTISGLYINRPSENNASLLGYIYNGVVKNLGMKDVNITGGNISTAGVAGRVISADEGFSNIYVIGTVTGTDYVGGVFGLFSSGSLEETVEVSNLYSTATVTGNEDVGGAVAYTATGMQFTNSYAAGVVTGTTNVGGLTGRINSDNGATVTNSFWNSDSTSVDNGLGSALNTTQMRQGSNFTGFDFTNDWRIANGNSFPYLRNAVPNPLPGYIEPESLVSGKSVAFSDGRIEAPNNSVYDDLEALTVELWFKINSSKLNGLVEKWSANTGFWLRVNANNRLEFNVQPSDASGSKIASSADEIVDLDTWYHLSAWYDGTDSRLYLNGEHVTDNVSSTNSGTLNNNNRTIGIGDLNWISGALDGAVDEVRIWKTARTEEEIRQNMFQQLNGDEEGLIAYYPFDETEGEIALDKTANENHGFLDSGISQSEDTHPYGTFITGNEGWHMMSSPFGDASYGSLLDTLWTQGFPGSDTPDNGASNVYFWDESAREFTSITNATVIPAQGTGFITFVYDDSDYDSTPDGFPKEIRLDSTQSSGVISPALSFTDSGTLANDGWNFVGNPYGATIDWDITNGWTQTNLDTSIYVWNNADSTYQTWNGEVGSLGDGLIAPWQGFWVKANAADPSITFTDEARSAGGILRKEVPVPELRLTISDGRATNSAIVMLYEQADVQKDKLDAYKLASLNDDYLSLFTQHEDGTAFDINALPTELEKPISIDIDFSRGGSLSTQTDFELSWNTESLPEDWQFTLRDNVTGEEIDLREPSAISLQLSASKAKQKETDQLHLVHQVMKPKVMKAKSDTNPRFTLTITSSQAVSNEPIIDLPTTVELQQNYPNPFNPNTTIAFGIPQTANVTLEVFDVLGRKVATLLNGQKKTAGRHTFNFDASSLSSGMYIYRLVAGNIVITKKLTLIK